MIEAIKKCLTEQDETLCLSLLASSVRLRQLDGQITESKGHIKQILFSLTHHQSFDIDQYQSLIIVHIKPNLYMKFNITGNHIASIYIDQPSLSLTRYRIDFAYDGTCFEGFQRQKKQQRTVQATLESVFSHFSLEPVSMHASGRTDKGVHALKQTAHFDADIKLSTAELMKKCADMLPGDIQLLNIEIVPPVYHARFDAKTKTYTYRLEHQKDPFKHHHAYFINRLDQTKLLTILTPLKGTHDFLSFSKFEREKNTIRTILDISIDSHETQTLIHITANGFLRYMMRIIIGNALYDYIKDKNTTQLNLKHPSKNAFKQVAPAQGLYLKQVNY